MKLVMKKFRYVNKYSKRWKKELNSSVSLFCSYILLNEIKQLSATKKSLYFLERNKYIFLISPSMGKPFIKLAFENYFNTKIQKINTLNVPAKKKYTGKYAGYKSRLKKAIVSFEPTADISLFSDI